MIDHDHDPERMAALFVSGEGDIRYEPDWGEALAALAAAQASTL